MNKKNHLWAVVQVWRGLPKKVEVFSQEKSARKRERQLHHGLAQEDEIGVFQICVPKRERGDRGRVLT
ncbi:MAG: hypothetical protein ACYDCJ_12175 [Gammaproteobacteria bacterium]